MRTAGARACSTISPLSDMRATSARCARIVSFSGFSLLVAPHGDIEPGVGRGERHVAIADGGGDRPGQRRRALLQRGHEDRAGGDVDEVVAARAM